MKCSECRIEVLEWFYCRDRDLNLCRDCQDKFKMKHCPFDMENMHEHVKFPLLEDFK